MCNPKETLKYDVERGLPTGGSTAGVKICDARFPFKKWHLFYLISILLNYTEWQYKVVYLCIKVKSKLSQGQVRVKSESSQSQVRDKSESSQSQVSVKSESSQKQVRVKSSLSLVKVKSNRP